MKLIIAGAGGVGGYLGARLAARGMDVTLIARGATLRLLRDQGVTLLREGKRTHQALPVLNSADPDQLGACRDADIVLFCCKTQDTEGLAQQLIPHLRTDTLVASLQNGVDNEAILQRLFGQPPVGGVCMGFGAHRAAEGVIEVSGDDGLILGEYPTGVSPRVNQLTDRFRDAGFDARTSDNILRELWQKLVMNAGCNPLSALLDKNSRQLVEQEESARLVKNIMREAAAAAAADGVDFAPRELEQMYQLFFQITPLRSSMQVDARRGTPLELSGIMGPILDRSGELGIQAPVTGTVHALLRLMFDSR